MRVPEAVHDEERRPGAIKMAQQVRAPVVEPGDPSYTAETHMVAGNH